MHGEGGGDAREDVRGAVAGAEHQPGEGGLVGQFGEEDDAEDDGGDGEADHGLDSSIGRAAAPRDPRTGVASARQRRTGGRCGRRSRWRRYANRHGPAAGRGAALRRGAYASGHRSRAPAVTAGAQYVDGPAKSYSPSAARLTGANGRTRSVPVRPAPHGIRAGTVHDQGGRRPKGRSPVADAVPRSSGGGTGKSDERHSPAGPTVHLGAGPGRPPGPGVRFPPAAASVPPSAVYGRSAHAGAAGRRRK